MNGQEVKLKNPGTDGLKDFLILAQALEKVPEGEQSPLNYFDDKTMDAITRLIKLTVKKTFKEVNEEIDSWSMGNFMIILNEIIIMCSPQVKTDDQNRIDKLKEKINNAKSSTQE